MEIKAGPQAVYSQLPFLPGGPRLHSFPSPSSVLYPEGPLVQKLVGQMRSVVKLLGTLIIGSPLTRLPFPQHVFAGEAAGMRGEGLSRPSLAPR